MITRDKALTMLQEYTPEEHLIHHALETEAVMRGLAQRLGRDPDTWGMAGLLHDIDYAATHDTPERHGIEGAKSLEGQLPLEALHAIKAHNGERNGTTPESDFDFALRCGESVTGLISANALVRPQGMEGMKPKSLKKKMKDKSFAAKVNRDIIRECDCIGLELGEFFAIAIAAITPIAGQVGLDKT